MPKSSKLTIRQSGWGGGIADNPRAISAQGNSLFTDSFAITKHFDIFSRPNILTPYRSFVADTNDGSTSTGMKQYVVKDFLYSSVANKMYGLGVNGSGNTKIVFKNDATTGNWTVPSSSEGDSTVWYGCFVEFKDYLWGFQGTNKLWRWGTLSGTPSITNSVTTTGATITSVANGVIAADANLYLAYNNVIMRIAPGLTVTDTAKTVPDNYKITSLTNFGNYLAIAAAPVNPYNGVSKVFLWNLTSDLFQETIDWGEGELRILETVEGSLVGVTDRYLNSSIGAGRGSMVIQVYSGGSAQVIKEIFTEKLTGVEIPRNKVLRNNRLFWSAKIFTNTTGTEYNEGIWSFGRKSSAYPTILSLDYIDENINTSGIQGIGSAGNYFYIAHSADGSIDKIADTSTYTFTSIFESNIFNWGDSSNDKKLVGVELSYPALTSGQSVTVKMKVDGDTSWTTIGTDSTVGSITRKFLDIESTELPFPSGNEYKFRVETVGGVSITGFNASAEFFIAP